MRPFQFVFSIPSHALLITIALKVRNVSFKSTNSFRTVEFVQSATGFKAFIKTE